MGLLDTISGVVGKFAPKNTKPAGLSGGGIGSGHGMVPFDDNMIVSKPAIIAHTGQIFFNFLAMACFANVASFQAKFKIGPSGLSGFAIFTSIAGMLLSTFMLLIPVAYEKYDKFIQLARTLKEVRVSFILTGAGATFSLLISFISTISAWTQPGCKDPATDPNAEGLGDDFKNGLPGWCSTKKAGAIFFWLTFAFWAASVTLLVLDWRSGRLNPHREPPFNRPTSTHQASEDAEEDEDASYTHIEPIRQTDGRYDEVSRLATNQNPFNDQYASPSAIPPSSAVYNNAPAGRPSMDAYGAFSDPAPSGFGTSYGGGSTAGYAQTNYAPPVRQNNPPAVASGPPLIPEPDLGPRVSRTMQYADPYAAVRASISGGPPNPSSPTSAPPSYENNYQGYR